MSEWAAEQQVGEELAEALVREQFAPLPERSVSLLSTGWDYVVHLVDERWVFRFPRREVVVPGTEREISALGRIAPLLPVSVPAPTYVGQPSAAFPWPFYGARYLPGVESSDAHLSDDDRTRLARPLARALRSLHGPETMAAAGDMLPTDPIRRADMSFRVPKTREALAAVRELGLWEPPAVVEEILAAASALPQAESSAVCHGDLHFRQLLLDGGELSGIIDWVDVCRSDPGVDLQLVWSFLPPEGRDAFLAEYGSVSRGSLLRARVLALFLNAILARYGHVEGLETVEAEALAGLARTTS
ncbi:MAG TPA: phosphotransferase [Gaiellaceae bacterium]|nr:phosphotransferase [Gaiellaceae bacterium]